MEQTSQWRLRGPSEFPGALLCLQKGGFQRSSLDQQQPNADYRNTTRENGVLRCAVCDYQITRQTERIAVNEQHEHVFANPRGYIYHIGCFAQAPGCVIAGEESNFFSWFPGYTWQIALCGHCLAFLGWAFHSPDFRFFGLILDHLRADAEHGTAI